MNSRSTANRRRSQRRVPRTPSRELALNTASRPIPPPRDPIFRVTRILDNGVLQSSTVADVFPTYNFALQYLTAYSEFTALFDQYRIEYVESTFWPTVTSIDAQGAWINSFLLTAVDYDDGNSYSNVNEGLQVATATITPLTKMVTRKFSPRCALAAYSGTFTSYAQASVMQWIDCGSPGVQHYGLKVAVPLTGAQQSWRVMHKYHLAFRRVR